MEETKQRREVRILVADDELIPREAAMEFLKSHGFSVQAARNGAELRAALGNWQPHFILYDLMLPDMNALQFLKSAKANGILGDDGLRVFVMSGHNNQNNVRECIKAGASDFLVKPLNHGELLARLVIHVQQKRRVKEFAERQDADYDAAQYIVHLTDLTLREALKGAPVDACLFNIAKMTEMALKAVRVSVVKCDVDNRQGFVLASSDKRDIDCLQIDLGKYPEIMYVMRSELLLALDNLATDPTMHFVTRQDKQISFNSMIVSPIRIGTHVWGVMSVRMPDSKTRLQEHEIRFAQLTANVAGLVIMRDPAVAQVLAAEIESLPGDAA